MKKSVLVVDDDEIALFVLSEMCSELGYSCLKAGGGGQAVELLVENANRIAVVLMDIHMPEVSGLDAISTIRALPDDPPKNVPVVAATADVNWHEPTKWSKHGFASLLQKPCSLGELLRALRPYSPN